jgi:hypothetical protein
MVDDIDQFGKGTLIMLDMVLRGLRYSDDPGCGTKVFRAPPSEPKAEGYALQ